MTSDSMGKTNCKVPT